MTSTVSEASACSSDLEDPKVVILKDGDTLYTKLQCVQCGKCLSVRPVSENDGQYTCGRCCPEAKQCALFERFAQHLQFTCIFKGCTSTLNWGQVDIHEKMCKFREVSCPFSECTDRYQYNAYQSHFEEAHNLHQESYCSDLILIDSLSPCVPYINLHCIISNGLTFLVFIRIYKLSGGNGGMCQFSVLCMTSEKDHSNLDCELRINLTSNIALTKTLNCANIMPYIDTQDCLSCLYESCDKPNHLNIGNALSFEVLEFLTKKPFSYAVKISKINSMDTVSNLECPICYNEFGERIYLCPGGHSLCEHCGPILAYCPLCRMRIEELVRNYSLEKVIAESRK
ncbi:unnamed protein product [Callosobruchus maculatus]|uniref:RING-type domain-containing protein n=1 Tax=Callosobruchus maculatus TaxID=64391 RepID=A0A653DBS6_CALMS|nr:unnamed protein product [Callosobruchus maculatus]